MLAMTSTALEVVKAVTTTEGAPDGAGLRIAASQEQEQAQDGGLEISVAATPSEEDQVLTGADGGVVFLEPQAAQFLDDKVLDAQVDENGQASFTLAVQGPADGQTPQA